MTKQKTYTEEDLKSLELIEDADYRKQDGVRTRTYLCPILTRNLPDKVIEHLLVVREYKKEKSFEEKKVVSQKFLCVNGKRTGVWMTQKDAEPEGYVRYNLSRGNYNKPFRPQCVLVWFPKQ